MYNIHTNISFGTNIMLKNHFLEMYLKIEKLFIYTHFALAVAVHEAADLMSIILCIDEIHNVYTFPSLVRKLFIPEKNIFHNYFSLIFKM